MVNGSHTGLEELVWFSLAWHGVWDDLPLFGGSRPWGLAFSVAAIFSTLPTALCSVSNSPDPGFAQVYPEHKFLIVECFKGLSRGALGGGGSVTQLWLCVCVCACICAHTCPSTQSNWTAETVRPSVEWGVIKSGEIFNLVSSVRLGFSILLVQWLLVWFRIDFHS